MNRIENRTRANFEKRYGMYPFQEGGRFAITYEIAKTHELRDYLVINEDSIDSNVGDAYEYRLDIGTVKDHLKHMPEADMRRLAAGVIQFKELKKWVAEEVSRRKIAQNPKSVTKAKRIVKQNTVPASQLAKARENR